MEPNREPIGTYKIYGFVVNLIIKHPASADKSEGGYIWLCMAIHGYIFYTFCILDVWTCVLAAWTCIWGVSGLVCVASGFVLGCLYSFFVPGLFWGTCP